MVAVINYNTGNLRSVCNALNRLGADYKLTADRDEIISSDKVLLPGVGEASSAMNELRKTGLDLVIPQLTQPVLGICIGMQLMCKSSEEGNAECMGIFDAKVKKMVSAEVKIPHIGWNQIYNLKSGIFKNIDEDVFMYFVHSYAADLCKETIAKASHDIEFSAALSSGNFYGVQFHPEKSGDTGSRIIENFLSL